MARASQTKQRIEWMWKSNPNPFDSSEPAEWRSYSDVEMALIEEAYARKQPEAVLDDYTIIFEHLLQISNVNEKNQRPVKRVVNNTADFKLREERFASTPIVSSKSFGSRDTKKFVFAAMDHFNIKHGTIRQPAVLRMLVELAAKGLAVEGKKVGKGREAEWMARKLLEVKTGSDDEIWQLCAYLYCMESFLYKKMNEIMRAVDDEQYEPIWQSKIATFGPYVILLLFLGDRAQNSMTVYRVANLSNDLLEPYRRNVSNSTPVRGDENFCFPALTSTSRNRAAAEKFNGNVLFVIRINPWDGYNVSPYSPYPHEEEQLLVPHFGFYITSCTFDKTKNRWEIHLQTSE